MKDFGDIRSLVHQPYSRSNWETLCELVHRMSQSEQERVRGEVIPYILAHTKQWRSTELVCPMSWRERLLEGWRSDALALIRHLDLSNTIRSREQLGHLTRLELPNTHVIDLDGNRLTDSFLRELLSASWLENLVELRLARNRISTQGASWISQASQLKNIRRLRLEHNNIGESGAWYLAHGEHLHRAVRAQWSAHLEGVQLIPQNTRSQSTTRPTGWSPVE